MMWFRPPGEVIRIVDACQNNLKGITVEIPKGRVTVIAGVSGAGKSSLAVEVLFAEGQRRYVETFSPYARQFFARVDPPAVRAVEGVEPAVRIETGGAVRTSRATVGTLTEIDDLLKGMWAALARWFCPACGEAARSFLSAETAAAAATTRWRAEEQPARWFVAWPLWVPNHWPTTEVWAALLAQGFTRVVGAQRAVGGARWWVLADRFGSNERELHQRLTEAIAAAWRRGNGVAAIGAWEHVATMVTTEGEPAAWEELPAGVFFASEVKPLCPNCGREAGRATPGLFSYNSPLGACPTCRGFGEVLEIDWGRVIPDPSRTLREGAIRPWQGGEATACQRDLEQMAEARGVRLDVAWAELSEEERRWVIEGDEDWEEDGGAPGRWYGVRRYFEWVERRRYRLAMRALLARYRTARPCPSCRGDRLVAAAREWRVVPPSEEGLTIAEFRALPLTRARIWWERIGKLPMAKGVRLAWQEVAERLDYLHAVGVGYLSLARPARTLSGGELQRIRLATALGVRLTETTFVLEEPTAGLHARDVDRVVEAIHRLAALGNSVVVLEHDPQVIAAADWVIELGPGSAEEGGRVVFCGPPAALVGRATPTGEALARFAARWGEGGSGQEGSEREKRRGKEIATGERRVREREKGAWLTLRVTHCHNLHGLQVELPLTGLTVIAGVSGSGKSTLVEMALLPVLRAAMGEGGWPSEVEAMVRQEGWGSRGAQEKGSGGGWQRGKAAREWAEVVGEVVWVDQRPLTRSSRSVPATVMGAWDLVRSFLARTPEARRRGLNAAAFSFNSGPGRCPACQGGGYERVEMQFLADLYLRCPVCDGQRFRHEVLAVRWLGANAAEWLAMSVSAACERLQEDPEGRKVAERLAPLRALGLGHLRLGQPTPTLSSGEAQRLKLAAALAGGVPWEEEDGAEGERRKGGQEGRTRRGRRVIVLDEPTAGLHEREVAELIAFLRQRSEEGDGVLVVEHHRAVIAAADWVVELGPEGGEGGGRVVFAGPPAALAQASTPTGEALRGGWRRWGRRVFETVEGEGSKEEKGGEVRQLSRGERARWVAERRGIYRREGMGEKGVIEVIGARAHNLKGIDVTLPRHALTVITGRSGSGKSTLAFDLLFAEGQRRYLVVLDAFARQFVQPPPPAEVEGIWGLPPTAAIEQRTSRGGWKSTVATVAELSPYLRLLWAKLGTPHCPRCGVAAVARSAAEWAEALAPLSPADGLVAASLVRRRKGVYQELADWAAAHGYPTLFVDGVEVPTQPWRRLDRFREHDLDLPVARGALTVEALTQAVETAWRLSDGWAKVRSGGVWQVVSREAVCPRCGAVLPPLDPRLFSHHSPLGWCPECEGTGRQVVGRERGEMGIEGMQSFEAAAAWEERHLLEAECPACRGRRLRPEALAVRVAGLDWEGLEGLSVAEVQEWLKKVKESWGKDRRAREIAAEVLPGLQARLSFLREVGVDYLVLGRAAPTLSGGEAQRLRLAAQLGARLTGVVYVLDEPTIGLHPADDERLLGVLQRLRDEGATVVVVEHERRLIEAADWVIDLGPGAGREGGKVVAVGPPAAIAASEKSVTGRFLRAAFPPLSPRPVEESTPRIVVRGAEVHNLKGFDVPFPLGRLTVVAGVSGSGKSTLVHEVLVASVVARRPVGCRAVEGGEKVERVVVIDQSPIGKTSRSTPATYLGIFDPIRRLFAATPEARANGFGPSWFSFNGEGACPVCRGNGWVSVEMAFLPAVREPCDGCGGSRFRPEVGRVRYRGERIAEVLAMDASTAASFFSAHPTIARPLAAMAEVGLGYLPLGQPCATLSGGEAQRLKLVAELTSRSCRPTLYVLDEPTVGLHMADVALLLPVLQRLVDQGHTVVVIEHDVAVWWAADWFVELGPGGGVSGGHLLYAGPVAGAVGLGTPSGRVLAQAMERQRGPGEGR
ncbi:MAG: excinuclease ABC subunit UvrA [Hydrogenophilus sp.]|nr:excinuclease ABC subunit UvrA [Hydrogenophilus sp.]